MCVVSLSMAWLARNNAVRSTAMAACPIPRHDHDREGLVLVHKGDGCEPDFDGLGLTVFGNHPDMYSLVSVDVDHADKVKYSKRRRQRQKEKGEERYFYTRGC